MKTTYKNLQIVSEFKGDKPANWGVPRQNYNNHLIKVRNVDTGKRIQFEFWASIARPEITTESELLDAFGCLVSDSLAGKQDFEEFCSDFGYDTDSRKAERIHKGCVKATDKVERLIGDIDIYDFANELQTTINE
jgi:hypothetical protein